jgi:hypothetical protein
VSSKYVDIDVDERRLKKLLAATKDLPSLRLGVIGSKAQETHPDDGPTNAEIGAWHELGAGVPRRSWLRDWIDGNMPKIRSVLYDRLRDALLDDRDPRQSMDQAGMHFTGEVQQRIANGIEPPLTEATKRWKARHGRAKDTPLIDTGQFRSSITHDLED